MHQLKGLIWKAYKVRLRSPISSAIDVAGPISVIIIYLCLKVLLGSLSVTIEPSAKSTDYFRNLNSSKSLNPQVDLQRHLACNKVLYFSQESNQLDQGISAQCGLELIKVSSRDELTTRLRKSLDARMSYMKEGKDLTRSNLTSYRDCLALSSNNSTSNEPNYSAGIVHSRGRTFDIYMTDIASGPIIHQPYTQGSSYNEYRLPGSDLNSGYHLLELCLARASSITQSNNRNITLDSLNIRLIPYPLITSPLIIATLYLTFQLGSTFCNAIATVMRISEERENGIHHYMRTAGVPAGLYWTSHLIVSSVHMALQSLVIAVLLAIPTTSFLADPMYEANITLRWSLLFTYSMAIQTYAMFVASFFDRTSQATLATCLLGVGYSCFSLFFLIQWNPYGFSPLYGISFYAITNPVSNFEAVLKVIYAIYLQTGESPGWYMLDMRIQGGGISSWTFEQLWILLIGQLIFYFFLTIFADQYSYCGTSNPFKFLYSCLNDLCFCNSIKPSSDSMLQLSKSRSSKLTNKPMDPNRICCSLRQVTIVGPSKMLAHTKGDPLKLTPEQLNRWRQVEHTLSKPQQYLVNRPPRSPSSHAATNLQYTAANQSLNSQQFTEPILLDETIFQHIVWSYTKISLQNLSINFRFNQVTFILGQTDLKELLFEALLGIKALRSGYIVLDGATYTSGSLSLARSQIGYLGERDIFLNEVNIFENLQFFGSLRDPSYTKYDSESHFILRLLHLTSRRTNLPNALTHRSARKLALAVACVGHTKLLLLVEPTLSLRWKPRCQVLSLLKKYKSIRSVVVDTSDIDEAISFGDRVVLLKNGQADLDGTPDRLSRKLCCGHWIVFEPHGGKTKDQNKSRLLQDNVIPLENLTSEIFKQDKLEKLDATKRSVYQELMKSNIPPNSPIDIEGVDYNRDASKTKGSTASNLSDDKLHKTTVILKIQASNNSYSSLVKLLKIFNSEKPVHGFRLSELTYESLEDVMVLRMSKAIYPDLPPDLLLSLSHRTRKTENEIDLPQVSVRKLSSEFTIPKVVRPIFGADLREMLKDRATLRSELFYNFLAIIVAVGIFSFGISFLPMALEGETSADDELNTLSYDSSKLDSIFQDRQDIEKFYRQRLGFFVLEKEAASNVNPNTSTSYLNGWKLNPKITGIVRNDLQESDANFVGQTIQNSKDLAAAIIFFDPKTADVSIAFEPYHPHAILATIRTFINYLSPSKLTTENSTLATQSDQSSSTFTTNRRTIPQSWHKILRGHLLRRLFYGISLALSEGVAMGALILAPLRHRTESRVSKVRCTYWLAMALFDMLLSSIVVVGYTIAIIIVEQNYSPYLLTCQILVMLLYKLASLPISYLVSILVESGFNGFIFMFMAMAIYGWSFAVFLKTFVEWTLYGEGYIYTIAIWVMHALPLTSLTSSITDINHLNHINDLCSSVPAFTATKNLLPLEGIQKRTLLDKLWQKVDECLTNGKSGIYIGVLHQQTLGILWDIYLILVFGTIVWTFLLLSERVFGLIARKFSSDRSANDPLKTMVRTPETSSSSYKWDREKDRLVSQYIRCMNETKYVKQMARNCLYVRIWLKPLSDQNLIDKQQNSILEPILASGQMRSDIQLELKTTLQIFIRIGNESARCKLDRIQLIEAYAKYVDEHRDTIVKYAVVDWTREMLYKILLHGHYNTKCNSAIT